MDFLDNASVFENAITCAEFGKFNYFLLALCGLVFLNCSISMSATSFILPSAQCDFRLNSSDKGLLSSISLLGMVFGSYFWGCLADLYGRKKVMMVSLLMDGLFSALSSVLTFYWPFLLCRLLSGFALSGYMGSCFSYLGEFQPKIYREKILSMLELFWTAGIILLPLIAWGTIPLNISYTFGVLHLSSWNLFLILCSLPSLLLSFWLSRFPESPKFLIECGEFDKALECLKWIYTENTGNPGDAYPVKTLVKNEVRCNVISIQSEQWVHNIKPVKKSMDLKNFLNTIWQQTKELFKPPHLKNIVLVCFIQFGLTFSYFTLMLWFPELFNRFEQFESRNPGKDTSVCQVSSVYIEQNSASNADDLCKATVGETVFINTLWAGIACIPMTVLMTLSVHRLGARFFLVMSLFVCVFASAALYFVKNSLQNLILSCIFEAFCGIGVSALLCMLVDLFPTNMRVMAAAASATFSRLGSLASNIMFGMLIDSHCGLLIIIFTLLLIMSSLLSLALPKSGVKNLD